MRFLFTQDNSIHSNVLMVLKAQDMEMYGIKINVVKFIFMLFLVSKTTKFYTNSKK